MKSSKAAKDIQERFTKDVGKLGFIVEHVTLGVPKPDKSTQEAINKRVAAAQELERKNTELQIASAEADKKRIEAKGIADYNQIVQQSISKEVLQKLWIEKWNGVMPKATGSGQLIQIPVTD